MNVIKPSVELSLTPHGVLHCVHAGPVTDQKTSVTIYPESVIVAFALSPEAGLLAILNTPGDSPLPTTLKFWRNYLAPYMEQLSHGALTIPPPSRETLQEGLLNLPPMLGAEYASTDTLQAIWTAFDVFCQQAIKNFPDGIEGFFKNKCPHWPRRGRVCFHLAENKQDLDYPFAFIATYATSVAGAQEMQHKPLRHALQEYAGNANKTYPRRRNAMWLGERNLRQP